ncbi:MAG: hypothetical protein RQ982_03675 [Gammaproteobacteria bacterium]|nr:hypothetical protein [Gammaproteobacteria bacterium]
MKNNHLIFTHRAAQYLLMTFIFCMTMLVAPMVNATYYYGGHHGGYYGGYRHYSYPYSYRHNYSYRNYSPRSYGYSYSRRHYNSYTPANTSKTVYNNTTSNDDTSVKEISSDRGWQLLAQNQPAEAFKVFAEQAGNNQSDGIPKAGYALSVALQGQHDKAAWAMRRAFRIAPDSLHYIDIDKTLQPAVSALIDEYAQRQNSANNQPDAAFMVAALNYLLHEDEAASIAIERAIQDEGDDSQSAENLQRLLTKHEAG